MRDCPESDRPVVAGLTAPRIRFLLLPPRVPRGRPQVAVLPIGANPSGDSGVKGAKRRSEPLTPLAEDEQWRPGRTPTPTTGPATTRRPTPTGWATPRPTRGRGSAWRCRRPGG